MNFGGHSLKFDKCLYFRSGVSSFDVLSRFWSASKVCPLECQSFEVREKLQCKRYSWLCALEFQGFQNWFHLKKRLKLWVDGWNVKDAGSFSTSLFLIYLSVVFHCLRFWKCARRILSAPVVRSTQFSIHPVSASVVLKRDDVIFLMIGI